MDSFRKLLLNAHCKLQRFTKKSIVIYTTIVKSNLDAVIYELLLRCPIQQDSAAAPVTTVILDSCRA